MPDKTSVVVSVPTIAVLAFADMSPNKDQEYFADGLSEELSDHLSRLPGLRVIGRSSAFSFKGKNEDLRTIGRALGVKHLLEGSVRKAGDQLRITAQLVDSNGTRVWSDTYDQKLGDIFVIQDAVAKSVAVALSVTLTAGEVEVARGGTRNAEAYDAYLAGKAVMASGAPEDIQRGIAHLERAVALDPQFALGWSELAQTYAGAGARPERSGAEWNAKALHATTRALEIAPD
jgi:TolB-like protein